MKKSGTYWNTAAGAVTETSLGAVGDSVGVGVGNRHGGDESRAGEDDGGESELHPDVGSVGSVLLVLSV